MTILYLDMDGVVADFDTAATDFLQSDHRIDIANKVEGRWPPGVWEKLRANDHFYRDLPKMAQADELVALARRFRNELGYELRFLTAIPVNNDMPWTFWDKFQWAKMRYPEIPIFFGPYSKDKQLHCKPNDILVDDREDNCASWQAAQGRAVKVNVGRYQEALDELYAIFKVELGDQIDQGPRFP